MGIDLKKIESDGQKKDEIIEELKGNVDTFYGTKNYLNGVDNSYISIYKKSRDRFITKVKDEFSSYFIKEVTNFGDVIIKGDTITARASDYNKIILTINDTLIFLTFDLKLDDRVIKKEYRISIESNFKMPSGFTVEKSNSGWEEVKYQGWSYSSFNKLSMSQLNTALEVIKEAINLNSSILNKIEFCLTASDSHKPSENTIIQNNSIKKIIEYLCEII